MAWMQSQLSIPSEQKFLILRLNRVLQDEKPYLEEKSLFWNFEILKRATDGHQVLNEQCQQWAEVCHTFWNTLQWKTQS